MNAPAKPELLRERKQRAPTACVLHFPAVSDTQRQQDKIDLLTVEVDRLRTLLNGGSKVRALYDKWQSEADRLERATYKTEHGQAEAHQRARRLRAYAGALGSAAGYK